MSERDEEVQERVDINEMMRSPGWQHLEARLREEIRILENELKIDIEGKSAQEVGEIYIRCIQGINGLRRVFGIIEDLTRE